MGQNGFTLKDHINIQFSQVFCEVIKENDIAYGA